jgi:hypothetical protein
MKLKMRFKDRVSQAIWELERAGNPPLRAQDVKLDAFDHETIKRPPNTQPAIDILRSLEMIEAREYIDPRAGGSHDAKYRAAEAIARAIANVMMREGLIDIEVGDLDQRGYPVRGRVRVMKPESE